MLLLWHGYLTNIRIRYAHYFGLPCASLSQLYQRMNPCFLQTDREALEAQIRFNEKSKEIFADHIRNADVLVAEVERMAQSAPSGFSNKLKGVLQEYKSRHERIVENLDRKL